MNDHTPSIGAAGALALPVNPAPANSGTIPLAVNVPSNGTFLLTVDSTDVVTLAATGLNASGVTTPITVADSRNSFPGWSVSGQDSAWAGTGTAAGGSFYAQYFLFIDSGIAYGPWISVEALLAPIIGGVGTVFGPLLGALVVKTLGELAKLVTGDAPGLDLVIYGGVLILVVAFAPRGIAGVLSDLRMRWARWRTAPERAHG